MSADKNNNTTSAPDIERRFAGVRRLYGTDGLARLQAAHSVVVGVGGVGSWVAEALVRNAVGKLTLVDLDNVAESNVNRQLHALEGNFGKAKVTAMRERLLLINPYCQIVEIEDFVTPENITQLLDFNCDMVLDCTDDAKAKVAMAQFCRARKISLLMSGSAGGRLDPGKMQVADLAHVSGDRLLAKVRNQLRRNDHFPKAAQNKKPAKFGIQTVFIDAPALRPETACMTGNTTETAISGLNCAGYGSSVCVTAAMGFCLASQAIMQWLDI